MWGTVVNTGINKQIRDQSGLENVLTHLSDFDWCASHVGDAWQRTTLTTLGVGDHPAVTTLQGNLAKLDSLSAGYT